MYNNRCENRILNSNNTVYSTIDIDEKERSNYVVEVLFKGSRKGYYRNNRNLLLKVSDYVVVAINGGEDMGKVKNIYLPNILPEDIQFDGDVVKKGNTIDIRRLHENRKIEDQILIDARKQAKKHQLDMKFLDIEYKFDRRKLVFFFTADGRIDFRELVKTLASEYRTRIELRQIGARDEAQRVGGLGVCGRETCCSSFLKSFSPINVSMARDQNLFIKPEKFSGLCGKLMCCLKYEHNYYVEQREGLPVPGTILKTDKGDYAVTIYDIFNKTITIQNKGGDYITFTRDEFVDYIKALPKESIISQTAPDPEELLLDDSVEDKSSDNRDNRRGGNRQNGDRSNRGGSKPNHRGRDNRNSTSRDRVEKPKDGGYQKRSNKTRQE